MMALLEPGDEVLYPDPGFPGYPSITLGLGAVPVPFELSTRNHFQPDLAEIGSKITRRTRMLITNSPGNPTGTVYTDAVQQGLAELAVKHDLWFSPMKSTRASSTAANISPCCVMPGCKSAL